MNLISLVCPLLALFSDILYIISPTQQHLALSQNVILHFSTVLIQSNKDKLIWIVWVFLCKVGNSCTERTYEGLRDVRVSIFFIRPQFLSAVHSLSFPTLKLHPQGRSMERPSPVGFFQIRKSQQKNYRTKERTKQVSQ